MLADPYWIHVPAEVLLADGTIYRRPLACYCCYVYNLFAKEIMQILGLTSMVRRRHNHPRGDACHKWGISTRDEPKNQLS